MASPPVTRRYRRVYAALLRLYPAAFRRRYATSMEQTFHDLCRERHDAGRGLLLFALGVFAETSFAILLQRTALLMPAKKNILRVAIITAALLAIPAIGMLVTDEVAWGPEDFLFAGVMIFGTGFGFETIVRRSINTSYRAGTAMGFAGIFLLMWINLAVGVIGSEDHPANALYLAVLIVAMLGVTLSRLRARGMAWALFATALTQALVPIVAMILWRPEIQGEQALVDLIRVIMLNAFFVALFFGAGMLFRGAAQTKLGTN